MKLYHAKPSPLARRVRVLLRERGLLSRIDEIATTALGLTGRIAGGEPGVESTGTGAG